MKKSIFTKPSKIEVRPVSIITNKAGHRIAEVYQESKKYIAYRNHKRKDILGEVVNNALIIDNKRYLILEDSINKQIVVDQDNKIIYRIYNRADYDLNERIRKARVGDIIGKIFVYIFLITLAITVLFPFYWMLNTSLKTYSEFQQVPPTFWPKKMMWINYAEAFKKGELGYFFVNTVYVGIVSTLLSLVITIFAAFAFARLQFPGRDTLFSMLLGTMMIPGEMFTITNYTTVSKVDKLLRKLYDKARMKGIKNGGIWGRPRRATYNGKLENITPFQNLLINLNIKSEEIWRIATGSNNVSYDAITFKDTYAVLIIPFLVSVYYIYLLRQNFKQIPNELYLAAKVDGTSDFGYLWKVMIPLSAPTIVTITILKMMGAWNSYVWPRLATSSDGMKLITNGIRSASFITADQQTDYPLQMAAVVIVTIPLFLVFLCFRKYIMRGVSKSGTKG